MGCFKKKSDGATQQEYAEPQTGSQKFAYVFERRNRRNPYIGVGILPQKKTVKKTDDKKEEVKPQQDEKESLITSGATAQPINRWPGDESMTKLLKETYAKLDEVTGRLYEEIMDSFEHFDEISDDDFVKTFTNIYIIYRFYYQSKRGQNLKKYSKVLKSYIKSIEGTFNPVRYIYEYLGEIFTVLRNDFVKAQSKPSLFQELKSDFVYINQLLQSPLLTVRKKKFIDYIEKINKVTKKRYKELNRQLELYLSLYNDYKNSGVSVNGYVYSKDKEHENVLFVSDGVKRSGDIFWGDVKILKIGKGEVEIFYKGEKLILHLLEE